MTVSASDPRVAKLIRETRTQAISAGYEDSLWGVVVILATALVGMVIPPWLQLVAVLPPTIAPAHPRPVLAAPFRRLRRPVQGFDHDPVDGPPLGPVFFLPAFERLAVRPHGLVPEPPVGDRDHVSHA